MLYEQDKKDYYGFNNDFFVVSDAKPIADSNKYLRRTKLATLADLKVIIIHNFRHSCASLLINNGANITLVAKYLGHTKIEETLNSYSHMFSTALDYVVFIIDSLEDDYAIRLLTNNVLKIILKIINYIYLQLFAVVCSCLQLFAVVLIFLFYLNLLTAINAC